MNIKLNIFLKFMYAIILAILIFIANGFFSFDKNKNIDAPYISNKSAFSFEITGNNWRSPEQSIENWFFNQKPPFKYRVLGKIPILFTYESLKYFGLDILESFYYSYLLWTFIFIVLFLFLAGEYLSEYLILSKLITKANFNLVYFSSLLMLATLPPVLFPFKFPVHGSPNEFLGYALITLSLLSLLKKKYVRFFIYSLIGIFCRETNLIVLLPFMFMSNWGLTNKVITSFVVILILFIFRTIWGGGGYNPIIDAAHNYKYPLESVLFIFLVFSYYWVLGILRYIEQTKNIMVYDEFIFALQKTFLISTVFVLAVVFLFARAREMRIEFILFFYYLPYGIVYILENIKSWVAIFKSIYSILILIIPCVLVYEIALFLTPVDINQHKYLLSVLANFYNGFGGGWKSIFYFHLYITSSLLMLIITSYLVNNFQKLRG